MSESYRALSEDDRALLHARVIDWPVPEHAQVQWSFSMVDVDISVLGDYREWGSWLQPPIPPHYH